MQFHQIHLFDFTSFFAWSFLNFLARCETIQKRASRALDGGGLIRTSQDLKKSLHFLSFIKLCKIIWKLCKHHQAAKMGEDYNP